MPPCPNIIWNALIRPPTHPGITRCPANQSPDPGSRPPEELTSLCGRGGLLSKRILPDRSPDTVSKVIHCRAGGHSRIEAGGEREIPGVAVSRICGRASTAGRFSILRMIPVSVAPRRSSSRISSATSSGPRTKERESKPPYSVANSTSSRVLGLQGRNFEFRIGQVNAFLCTKLDSDFGGMCDFYFELGFAAFFVDPHG